MDSKNKQMSMDTKKIIINLKKDGKSLAEIAKVVKRPRSSVQYVIQQFEKTKTIANKPRSGRPRKIDQRLEYEQWTKILKLVHVLLLEI